MRAGRDRTIWTINIDVDVQLFISLECLLQEDNLLFTFDTLGGSVKLALLITFHLVELYHLLNAL